MISPLTSSLTRRSKTLSFKHRIQNASKPAGAEQDQNKAKSHLTELASRTTFAVRPILLPFKMSGVESGTSGLMVSIELRRSDGFYGLMAFDPNSDDGFSAWTTKPGSQWVSDGVRTTIDGMPAVIGF